MKFEEYLTETHWTSKSNQVGSHTHNVGDKVTHKEGHKHWHGTVIGHTTDHAGKKMHTIKVTHSPNDSAKEGFYKDHYPHELTQGHH